MLHMDMFVIIEWSVVLLICIIVMTWYSVVEKWPLNINVLFYLEAMVGG